MGCDFLHYIFDTQLISKWADNFNMDDYMALFDPVNINTLLSQAIFVFILYWFRKELVELARALIKKIPQIKSFGKTEFELPDKTKEAVKKESGQLDKKLKPYQYANPNNPSGVFLSIFIDVEVLLRNIHSLYFGDSDRHTRNPHSLVNDLLAEGVFSRELVNDFKIAIKLRNKIVHGEQISNEPYEIELFSKTLLLLKEKLTNIIRKHEKRQLGDPLPGKKRQLGDPL